MMTSSNNGGASPFPTLPIVTPDPPRRSDRERYGLLFAAGITGLVVAMAMVGWFGYRFWSMRDVWSNIYVLHDRARSDDDRIQAAFALAHDPRVEQRQLWEMSLRLGLPELARYLMSEGVGVGLVAQDPQAFVSAVARSPDWPGWLRLSLTRALACASSQGHALSRERVGELCRLGDPVLRTWALYTLAVQPRPDPQTVIELESVSRASTPEHELAALLLGAVNADENRRLAILSQASAWDREHHPDTRRVWSGWRRKEGTLGRVASE